MINLGLRSNSRSCFRYLAALKHSCVFSSTRWAAYFELRVHFRTHQGRGQGYLRNRVVTSQGPVPLYQLGNMASLCFRITSKAELIVFAVYIPPQAPGPGHACLTTSNLCSSSILPIAKAPEQSRQFPNSVDYLMLTVRFKGIRDVDSSPLDLIHSRAI